MPAPGASAWTARTTSLRRIELRSVARVRQRVRVRRLAVGRDDDGDAAAALVHPAHQPGRAERLVVGMSGDHDQLIEVDMQQGRRGDALIGSPHLLRRALVQVAEADHQSPTAAASSRPILAVSRGPWC